MIDKTIIQTSKYYSNKIEKRLMSSFNGWKYRHFNDKECVKYIIDNPIKDFPNAIDKYNRYTNGAHRADFFRYYYLYINGGGFIDSDLMIYKNIDKDIQDYNFISVSSPHNPGCIFQGFLFVNKKSEIIYEALDKMYFDLDDRVEYINSGRGYLEVTKDLNKILDKHGADDVKLFTEGRMFYYSSPVNINENKKFLACPIGEENNWFGIHWFQEKIVHEMQDIKTEKQMRRER